MHIVTLTDNDDVFFKYVAIATFYNKHTQHSLDDCWQSEGEHQVALISQAYLWGNIKTSQTIFPSSRGNMSVRKIPKPIYQNDIRYINDCVVVFHRSPLPASGRQ